jgi:hypothetical protein
MYLSKVIKKDIKNIKPIEISILVQEKSISVVKKVKNARPKANAQLRWYFKLNFKDGSGFREL